ncbi:uncharacterized protein LOC124948593 [Vespa velutina]|uniref:uncharacterized protein LOC124948593 n=1 Tax=Vespa velutina TaxID=202808 RepID=UPI001FB3758E|nr:uncharacterized protein LOC124948593 [Vespa velutina]
MQKFILLRTYKEEDESVCKKLLKASVMYSLNHTYFGFLLGVNAMRIINILSIVFMFVLMLRDYPVGYCSIVLFVPPIILYIGLYAKFLYEARVLGNEVSEIPRIFTPENSSRFWIAEAYEDLSANNQEQDQPYIFMTEETLNDCNGDVSKHNKEIVGIISVCKSNWDPRIGWLKCFYVKKNYRRKRIGTQLMNQAMDFAEDQQFECVKTIVSQFQKHIINFYNSRNYAVTAISDKTFLVSITLYEYVFRTRYSSLNN